MAVSRGIDEDATLVLDAGTGLRTLSRSLTAAAFTGAIVVTHLHWDHIEGLPFFAKGDRPDSSVEVHLPAQDGLSGRDLLARLMAPPTFPITPDELLGHWSFHALEPGRATIGGYAVTSAEVVHKGGRTYGYRIDDGEVSAAYLPDHLPVDRLTPQLEAVVGDVDLLLTDAQFLDSEAEIAHHYGHSTIGEAIALATAARARSLVLFHHSPVRTDEQLAAIERSVTAPMPVIVAREGMTLTVGQEP